MYQSLAGVEWLGGLVCDVCHKDCGDTVVDGKTGYGPWATMCLACHCLHGVGLGMGRGQRYDLVPNVGISDDDYRRAMWTDDLDDMFDDLSAVFGPPVEVADGVVVYRANVGPGARPVPLFAEEPTPATLSQVRAAIDYCLKGPVTQEQWDRATPVASAGPHQPLSDSFRFGTGHVEQPMT